MSEIKRIPVSIGVDFDPWMDLGEETASDLLQHLQRDNFALRRLRDALSADMDAAGMAEPAHN